MELPVYLVIDRKPVKGCEIQNSCDARSQMMMQLKMVKSEADEDRYMAEIIEYAAHQRRSLCLLHGTKVIIHLVNPWRNTWRTVCADSYLSSVPAVDNIDKIRIRFVGVVNTDKNIYPMNFLNFNHLHEYGDYKKLVSINGDHDSVRSVATICLNKNGQSFVGNSEPATAEGPLYLVRWHQLV